MGFKESMNLVKPHAKSARRYIFNVEVVHGIQQILKTSLQTLLKSLDLPLQLKN